MRTSIVLILALLAGCGGGGGATVDTGGGGGGGTRPATVDASLTALGVTQEGGPRLDAEGDPLPADWKPLGAATTVNRVDELLLFGETDEGLANVYDWEDFGQDDDNQFRLMANLDDEAWAHIWMRPVAAAGDFDGDGRQELLIVTHLDDAGEQYAHLQDDALADHAPLAELLIAEERIERVSAIAGDFDGDGRAEAAVALVYDDAFEIRFLEYADGALRAFGPSVPVASVAPTGPVKHIAFAVGQLDLDPAHELAFVVNEYFDRDPSVLFELRYRDASARVFVLDDAATGFAELASGPAEAAIGATTRVAKSAALAMGDIDADGLDEIVLCGLTRLGRPDSSAGTDMGLLLYALDDARHALAPFAERWDPYPDPNPNDRDDLQWLEYMECSAADLDGDTGPEVVFGHRVLRWEDGGWILVAELPYDRTVFPNTPQGVHRPEYFTRRAVGRIVDGRRDNVLTWGPGLGGSVLVWGMVGNTMVLEDEKPVDFPEILQPVDLDGDSLALEFVEGSYRLVYTEPVVLAVLAAAPCGPGQDPNDCRTQFGISESSGVEKERTLSMTAGVIAGVAVDPNVPGVTLEAEEIFTLTNTVERSTSQAYEVTQTVVWETGPVQDSVIFTSIPYDQYRYRVVEPGNDESLRNREVLVSIPRRPAQLMVSREFYNRNVAQGSPLVELPHTEGDRWTYYTHAEALTLVAQHGGIASDPKDVGEGTGNITVTLEVGRAHSEGTSITKAWQSDVRATAGGAVAGFSVGESETNGITVTTGTKLIYAGKVGQLDAAHVETDSHSFGILAYPHPQGERRYQMVTYWVTPAR